MAYRNTMFYNPNRYLDAENETLREHIRAIRVIVRDTTKTDEQKLADIKAIIR